MCTSISRYWNHSWPADSGLVDYITPHSSLKPQLIHLKRNEIWKIFLQRLQSSSSLTKALRINKISIKRFSNTQRSKSTLNPLMHKSNIPNMEYCDKLCSVSLLDVNSGFVSEIRHQNEWRKKILLQRFPSSRFLSKTLRLNKPARKMFLKKSVQALSYNTNEHGDSDVKS